MTQPQTPQSAPSDAPRSMKRRTLGRAGAAATVVLGSMASKPVIASANYHCTVSGQASARASHKDAKESCKTHKGCKEWTTSTNWPSDCKRDKGERDKDNCEYKERDGGYEGTRCKDLLNHAKCDNVKTYRNKDGDRKTIKTKHKDYKESKDDIEKPSTCLEVLRCSPSDLSSDGELIREAICAYLNAATSEDYPCDKAEVKKMYQWAASNGSTPYTHSSGAKVNVLAFFKNNRRDDT